MSSIGETASTTTNSTARKSTKNQRDTETLGSRSEWTAPDGLLLAVEDLHVEFRTREGVAKAINGVSYDLSKR